MASESSISSRIMRGSCSWNDQPISWPSALAAIRIAPSAVVVATLPAKYASPSTRAVLLSLPDRARLSAFSERIGKTHGIRLSRRPLSTAPPRATHSDPVVPGEVVVDVEGAVIMEREPSSRLGSLRIVVG